MIIPVHEPTFAFDEDMQIPIISFYSLLRQICVGFYVSDAFCIAITCPCQQYNKRISLVVESVLQSFPYLLKDFLVIDNVLNSLLCSSVPIRVF